MWEVNLWPRKSLPWSWNGPYRKKRGIQLYNRNELHNGTCMVYTRYYRYYYSVSCFAVYQSQYFETHFMYLFDQYICCFFDPLRWVFTRVLLGFSLSSVRPCHNSNFCEFCTPGPQSEILELLCTPVSQYPELLWVLGDLRTRTRSFFCKFCATEPQYPGYRYTDFIPAWNLCEFCTPVPQYSGLLWVL